MDPARRQEILSAYRVQSQLFSEIARRRHARLATVDAAEKALLAVRSSRPRRLTPRAAEVLQLLADGYGNKEIAAHLVITAETAKTHVRNVIAALGARNRAHAVAIAFRQGLFPSGDTGRTS